MRRAKRSIRRSGIFKMAICVTNNQTPETTLLEVLLELINPSLAQKMSRATKRYPKSVKKWGVLTNQVTPICPFYKEPKPHFGRKLFNPVSKNLKIWLLMPATNSLMPIKGTWKYLQGFFSVPNLINFQIKWPCQMQYNSHNLNFR